MELATTFEDILKFIVYKCRENENPVADSLVAFLMNLQLDECKINSNFFLQKKNKKNLFINL